MKTTRVNIKMFQDNIAPYLNNSMTSFCEASNGILRTRILVDNCLVFLACLRTAEGFGLEKKKINNGDIQICSNSYTKLSPLFICGRHSNIPFV